MVIQFTILFLYLEKQEKVQAFDSIPRRKIEQKLLTYGLPENTVAAIIMRYKNTKVKVYSLDGDTDFFYIIAGVLQGAH